MVKSRVGVQIVGFDLGGFAREFLRLAVEEDNVDAQFDLSAFSDAQSQIAGRERGAPERPLVLGEDAHLRREMRGRAERHRVLFHTDRDERPSEAIDVRRAPIR